MAEEKKDGDKKEGGDKGDKKKSPPMSPGTIFAMFLAVGIGLMVLGMGVGAFIRTVGQAQVDYPQVIIGTALLLLGAGLYFNNRSRRQ